jgi:hypothetical protein
MRTWSLCSLSLLALLSTPAAAQFVEDPDQAEVPAPPPGSASQLGSPTLPAPMEAGQPQPAQPQPTQLEPAQPSASPYGQPVYQPSPLVYPSAPASQAYVASGAQPTRRGDRPEDNANAGEIVDLMVTSGVYGIFLGNSVVTWADLDRGSSDDAVRVRFVATLLGATLSLSGLLAVDAPRGVPTTMAMGLRYGAALSGFGAGAFSSGGSGEALLAVVSVGGLVGMGLGAALGYGLRPHPSRSRFVETGFFWGTAFGGMLAGAFSRGSDGRAVLGGMLAGSLGAMTVHSIVASLTPVHVGRGWLMNAAFAGGAGLAAFFTWGFGGGGVSGETYLGTMSATGIVALAVVFAVTDGIQDRGWDEEMPEVVRSMQFDVSPTQGGAVGTVRGSF